MEHLHATHLPLYLENHGEHSLLQLGLIHALLQLLSCTVFHSESTHLAAFPDTVSTLFQSQFEFFKHSCLVSISSQKRDKSGA